MRAERTNRGDDQLAILTCDGLQGPQISPSSAPPAICSGIVACWLACHLWEQLQLDEFWAGRLTASREGTRWFNVLKTLVSYRLIDPGSEWRLHRQWYEQTALGDLLGEDFGLVSKDNLYRCLDKLLAHKTELFGFLQQRWKALFQAEFDVLLYDLESPGFAQNFGSCGEVEGLHLVGVLTFGDEFREDVGLVGIQQKFRKALA